MFLLGVRSGFTSTLLGALWPEVYGLANLGGIRAVIVSAMVLSTAPGPGLSGVLIDAGVRTAADADALACRLVCRRLLPACRRGVAGTAARGEFGDIVFAVGAGWPT